MQKSKEQILHNIDAHLCSDVKPSEYLNQLRREGELCEHPLSMLAELAATEQSPIHHPEGNVWNHTMLVVDLAAMHKSESSSPRAFMWAALLHDIGKPQTTKRQKDKVTSYNHDKVGAKLTREFMSGYFNDEFIRSVTALVRWHMQILFVVKNMPFADIAKMKQQVNIKDVALLGKCDRLGRLNPGIQREEENIQLFLEKCSRA